MDARTIAGASWFYVHGMIRKYELGRIQEYVRHFVIQLWWRWVHKGARVR